MTGDLETSAITWGDTRLPYAIRRSVRRKKTVAVTVDPRGDVLLVPRSTSPPVVSTRWCAGKRYGSFSASATCSRMIRSRRRGSSSVARPSSISGGTIA